MVRAARAQVGCAHSPAGAVRSSAVIEAGFDAAISCGVGAGLLSDAMEACTMRVGSRGGSPRWIASTASIPAMTRPKVEKQDVIAIVLQVVVDRRIGRCRARCGSGLFVLREGGRCDQHCQGSGGENVLEHVSHRRIS